MSTPVGHENRQADEEKGPMRPLFLTLVNQTLVCLPLVCFFYVKSIYVKSHIVVVKKVELDRRNGYI
ncbi:hypothetical protein C3709_11300 [Lelliottia aquatilis]|uniref:Uncharacterized protein n=1 Tax=Lelliottia aquatilis TaxID=2080838 RepID=A0ABX4ZX78_9ENTR|nr:hypothetical protein [Lelliottia aquatilis]POZ24774.1 hypothetical protein C3708_13795 [Lelliottia sp. 7254-16]POZ16069.1 hypothetical protein C3Z09_11955 [Lelliottia aquatilis]POZ20281.1 hypothetical protein C3712_19335 [Lelliottia aquatilis]POZ25632.1 hypothetical protein C3711_13500 [Lelliottia aquatilis]